MARKREYRKRITTIAQQIGKMRRRGIIINNEQKAIYALTDIGYYRLGYYIFPFEVNYPELGRYRDRNVISGTTFEQIISFYEYNTALRQILSKALSRLEVSLRANIVNKLSMKYQTDPFWYIDKNIVEESFINDFYAQIYQPTIRGKGPIVRHHKKYNGRVAPIWKTIEFTTIGFLENLYNNLLSNADKCLVSLAWAEQAIGKFSNYLSVLREVRNACAHGGVIVDLKLSNPVKAGSMACPTIPVGEQNTLRSALRVITYMMTYISTFEAREMMEELFLATKELLNVAPNLESFIEGKTGLCNTLQATKKNLLC